MDFLKAVPEPPLKLQMCLNSCSILTLKPTDLIFAHEIESFSLKLKNIKIMPKKLAETIDFIKT